MHIDAAIVLAGGKSTRMGRDKALERIAGMSMLERIVRNAATLCAQVIVVGRESPPQHWPSDLPQRFVPDAHGSGGEQSGGPLVGVMRGLEILDRPALTLACDVPLISTDTLRQLIAAHPAAAIATMACAHGKIEPTVAVYTPALLPALARMLSENRRSLQQLTKLPGVTLWPVPAERAWEFLNVNDEASLREARRRSGGA